MVLRVVLRLGLRGLERLGLTLLQVLHIQIVHESTFILEVVAGFKE